MTAAAPAWLGGPLGAPRGDGRRAAGTVIKFGGSLLGRADWPRLARSLVAEATPDSAPCLLVVGGGAVVEGLRALDATVAGDAALLHRLAIDGMGLTARYVADRLGLALATEPPRAGPAVLDVAGWLAAAAPRSADLPPSWDTTSDSLAARVATLHGWSLRLAKSVPPPAATLDGLAAEGWLDRAFPRVARDLSAIEWRAPAS